MFKEQMNKIKNMFIKNTEDSKEVKNNKKKIENLVAFLVIIIITLIAINVILKDDNEISKENDSQYKELAQEVIPSSNNKRDVKNNELEEKIEKILNTMSGVRRSECTYYIFAILWSSCNV